MTKRAPRKVIFAPFMTGFAGVERLIVGLSRFLNDKGISHCIVTFSNSVDLQQFSDSPMDIVTLSTSRNPIFEAFALRRWLAQESRATGSNAPALMFDLKGAFYAGFLSTPYALHLTDPPSLLAADISKHAPSTNGGWIRALTTPLTVLGGLRAEVAHGLNARGSRKARVLIVMTERIRREIKSRYGRDAAVIRPGIQPPPVSLAERPRDQTLGFLSISRLVDSKRIDWIVDAFAAARHELDEAGDWVFEIVGKGPERDALESQARRLGLGEHVEFAGEVDDAGVELAYARASAFLMPASQGWGLPALEALARHVPIVVHEDSGVTEILPESPWVVRIADSRGQDLSAVIVEMARRIRAGVLESVAPPRVPLEQEWAERICVACSWLPDEVGR